MSNLHPAVPNSVDTSAAGPVCRPARKDEIHDALRLILSVPGQPASDAQITDFTRFAADRGIDPAQAWLAEAGGQYQWAVLPVANPGRTLLLFGPADYLTADQHRAATVLTQHVIAHYMGHGIHLVQALLEPTDEPMIELYGTLGFRKMADLIYLQTSPRRSTSPPPLPAGVRLLNYSDDAHRLFATAITESYHDSLDCPALAGLRDMEDVVTGHKGTGHFNPALWFLALRDEQPLGVLLLSPTADGDAMELVYLGLVPHARGQRLGDFFMRHALAATARAGCARLTLAVDAANAPALRLYYRHAMKRVTTKVAMMLDVRKKQDER